MKSRRFLKVFSVFIIGAMLAVFMKMPSSLAKESYPSKKIKWIVGYTPGGGIDTVARAISQFMQKHLKAVSSDPDNVGIIIKNLPGGNELRAMRTLYHADPDGYTIASGGDRLHTFSILGKLGFEFILQ